jgi:hypothetical protein
LQLLIRLEEIDGSKEGETSSVDEGRCEDVEVARAGGNKNDGNRAEAQAERGCHAAKSYEGRSITWKAVGA